MSVPPHPCRVDGFLNGRVALRQPTGGHRAGTDAVLLAAATPPNAAGLLLDAGAGAGAVGLMAAARAPLVEVGLIEIEPSAAELARENIRRNGLEARARVFETDLLSAKTRADAGLAPECASVVLTNPPFFAADRVRATPDPLKARAHIAAAPLDAWLRACVALLAPRGALVMIHRADALAECLAGMSGRLGAIAILPILPRAGAAASRILLRGKKGSKAPLSLLPPLILHDAAGRFTPEAEAICLGESGLALIPGD